MWLFVFEGNGLATPHIPGVSPLTAAGGGLFLKPAAFFT